MTNTMPSALSQLSQEPGKHKYAEPGPVLDQAAVRKAVRHELERIYDRDGHDRALLNEDAAVITDSVLTLAPVPVLVQESLSNSRSAMFDATDDGATWDEAVATMLAMVQLDAAERRR